MAAASLPHRPVQNRLPDTVRFTIPAHFSFLVTIRTAVGAIVGGFGGASDNRDLPLAADEAAVVLIGDAQPWTDIRVSIAQEDADVYIRIVSRRARPNRPLVVHEFTRKLLDSAVDSHEVFAERRRGYAFLQAAWDGTTTPC